MGWRDWFGLSPAPLTAAAEIADPRRLDVDGAVGVAFQRNESAREVWKIWREVGEIHYSTTQQARLVSRLLWDVIIDETPLDPETAELMLRVGFEGKLPELARLAAIHLQVAGGYYLVRDDEWKILPIRDKTSRVKEILDRADVIVKVLNPDPQDETQPDSPVLAALPVARELLLTRAQARASARNRTAQLGVVIYPLEGAGPDPEKFEQEFTEVITAPLGDEHSAASVVPNLIGFQSDHIERWKTLDLTGPIDKELYEKINALVRHLAVILDVPPEVLTGMGETNHWSQWAIQEDNWLGHVEPMAKIIGAGFALAMARAADTETSIEVVPDPAPLLQRRPALADVLEAFRVGLVSGEWARLQLGADEDDAPDAPPPAEDEPPSGDEPPAIEEPQPQTAAIATPFSTTRLMDIDRQATDSLSDLAVSVLRRVADRVGARMRAQLQGDERARNAVSGVPNHQLPVRLGVASVAGLDQLVHDTVIDQVSQQFGRVIGRAYADTRAAGVAIYLDNQVGLDAQQVFVAGLAQAAFLSLNGQPSDAVAWLTVQRSLAIAGGAPDPAPPAQAAAGRPGGRMPSIALGPISYSYVESVLGLVARAFRWVHHGGSGNDHPQHREFSGVEFDGEVYDDGSGIRWYPGDHSGCRCSAEPVWERVIP